MWKSTHSVCGTRPDKEADGKVQVDGDCTKFTHPFYYDDVVDGDDRHFSDIILVALSIFRRKKNIFVRYTIYLSYLVPYHSCLILTTLSIA